LFVKKVCIPYTAGISIEPRESYPYPEHLPEGRWAVYEIRLLNKPKDTVTLQLRPTSSVITLSHEQLVFHPVSWNTVQQLTVFAVDDDVNRDLLYDASFSVKVTSRDDNYDDVSIEDFTLTIEDNDEGLLFL